MKKIYSLLLILYLACPLPMKAAEFTFSENGTELKADIVREGNNIRIRYKVSGLNNFANSAELSNEERAAIQQISDAHFDMIVSCQQPKIKMVNTDIYGLDSSKINTPVSNDWLPLTKTEDIQRVKNLCNRY